MYIYISSHPEKGNIIKTKGLPGNITKLVNDVESLYGPLKLARNRKSLKNEQFGQNLKQLKKYSISEKNILHACFSVRERRQKIFVLP